MPGEEVPDQAGEDAAQHAPQAEHHHAGRRHQPDTKILKAAHQLDILCQASQFHIYVLTVPCLKDHEA